MASTAPAYLSSVSGSGSSSARSGWQRVAVAVASVGTVILGARSCHQCRAEGEESRGGSGGGCLGLSSGRLAAAAVDLVQGLQTGQWAVVGSGTTGNMFLF